MKGRWEYKQVIIERIKKTTFHIGLEFAFPTDEIRTLGEEGWELVSVIPQEGGPGRPPAVLFFKREITGEAKKSSLLYCDKCGSKLESNAKFCNKCGTKVGA